MLSGEGMQRRKTMKNNNKSNYQKLFCTTTTWNFRKILSYTFYGGNVVRVPVHFFSLIFIFTLHWSLPLQYFSVVLPTKKMSPLFFISRSKSLSPFISLSFAGLPPTSSFPLSLSCSIFQICGHDNLSKLNTLDNKDKETISAFRFRLYWLFCCLCFTRRWWL